MNFATHLAEDAPKPAVSHWFKPLLATLILLSVVLLYDRYGNGTLGRFGNWIHFPGLSEDPQITITPFPTLPAFSRVTKVEARLKKSDRWIQMPQGFALELYSLLRTMTERRTSNKGTGPLYSVMNSLKSDTSEPQFLVRLTLEAAPVQVYGLDSQFEKVYPMGSDNPEPDWSTPGYWFPLRRPCAESDVVEAALKAALVKQD